MLINLRNALMTGKRLPYDAEVEYLFADGGVGAYINSGILWKSSLRVKCTLARYQGTSYPLQSFFGARDVSAANAGYALGFNTNIKFVSDNSGTRLTSTINCGYYAVYTIDKKPNEVTISGNGQTETLTGGPSQAQQGTYPLYIFGLNNVGTAATTGMRLYSLQIWDNGVLVRDYIPVRKGTVGYLYDRVSGKLFGNAGTGDFVLGADVVPVEYIESHGTEYIDTGLKGRDGYDFEYRFRPIGPLPLGIGGEYESNQSCYIGLVRSNGNLAYNYSNPNVIVEVQSLTLGTDYNVKAHLYSGEQYFEVNGVRGGVGSRTGTFTSSYNLYLFAINSANQPTSLGVMRLYNFTAHLNTTPTRSFLPVRVGTEGAMMDVLTRRVYRNAGTGAFTYGNDLKYPIPAE